MSKPSFENINQWFFEYTEGNLSSAQEMQFLDFIKENPELIDDLKAWKLAKVTPIHREMPIAGLLKKTPFYTRPAAIATYSIFLIALAWFLIPQEDSSTLYVKSEVDTEIIKLKPANSPHLVPNITKEEGYNFSIPTSSTVFNSPVQRLKDNSGLETAISQSDRVIKTPNSTYESNLTEVDKYKAHVQLLAVSAPREDSEGLETLENSTTKINTLTPIRKASDLGKVIAYLNGEKSQVVDSNVAFTEQEIDKVTEKETVVTTKSTKTSFGVAMRKIKRMIDQPTALRNTRDPYFHAPMMTGFRANPAMAGRSVGNRVQATSRMQWATTNSRQLMNTVSWDGYIYALRGGVGVDLNYNTYGKGALNNYAVGVSYSPKFAINKNISFEPAIRFKMGVTNLNKTSNLIGSQLELNRHNVTSFFEAEQDITGSSLWYRDIGLGFMLNTNIFYVGFNADNLGRHDNNYYSKDLTKNYNESIYYTAVIGTEYQSLTKDISVNGYGLFQSYGDLTEFWLGANFQYKWLQFGAGVNTSADFGASAGFNFNHVTINYNIDYTKSKLFDRKYLSHQVTMKLLLKPNRSTTKFYNF